jgi:geranylgeranyl pyrophosphate synthase
MKKKNKVKKNTTFSVNLNDYYRDVKTEFQRHLEREISKESKSIAPLISKGIGEGKQLRPILCRLVSDSLGGDAHSAFECGMALELIHCGTLIHDDWLDGDRFRREAPALWDELGPRTAILVADLMVATGSLHGAISLATGKSLAVCARNLTEGAIADFTDKENYSESVYLDRIKRKTGALYSTAAELGALVSPRIDLASQMHKFGETVGIMYQITDDYLDLLNSIITKTAIGDLALGIPTLPITRLSRYPEYKEAIDIFIKTGKADKIIEQVKISDAQNIFDELISPWQEMSRKYLEEVPDSSHKLLLEQVPMSFSNELIARDKTKFHADVF